MSTDNRDDLQSIIGEDYRLQWIIGHGGMSTVWLADDPAHDREVAIKVLRPEFSNNKEFLTRFRNEANAAEGIESPNVVTTYDYREVQVPAGYTVCFIVLEYVRGESLADLIAREGKLDEPLALDVLEQAAHGLATIHRAGLVHRDIKPGNLMVTQNGQVKITDFGIAKAAATVPLTRTGMVVGTAQYVSPEQAQGLKVTAASDVYSLGVVGYEMLAGTRPFGGDSSVSVALAHVSAEPPALSTSVSAPARELIEIALRKDPSLRFRDGNDMQLSVAKVRRGERPLQPDSTASTKIAAMPSATASTQMLASVAQPTTVRPATTPPPKPTPKPVPQPLPEPENPPKKKGGFGLGIVIAILVLLIVAGGVWALSNGAIGGSTSRTTPPETTTEPEPTVITETEVVTPTITTEAPAPAPQPERQPSNTSAPGTLRFIEPPSSAAPAPAPEREQRQPQQQQQQQRETPLEQQPRETATAEAPVVPDAQPSTRDNSPADPANDSTDQPGGGA